MLLIDVEQATKSNRLVHQLFSVKRCFGAHSSVGVVVGPGIETDRCSTIAELVRCGHITSGFEWLDPFLSYIPRVTEVPCVIGVEIVPPKYSDGGPPCPWDVARKEQEAAKARVLHRRLSRRASWLCDCLSEKKMPYKFENEKKWLFTDTGQRKFLAIRDKVSTLLKTSGAFMMSHILTGGDWECLACVDRLVELGEIREILQSDGTAGQDRVFVEIG